MKKEEVKELITMAKSLKSLNKGLDAWCSLDDDLDWREEAEISKLYNEKEKELSPLKVKKKAFALIMGKLSELEGEVYNAILDCFEADDYEAGAELNALWDCLVNINKMLGEYYENI